MDDAGADRDQTERPPDLLFERQGGIATLTLNRPAARNALTTGLFLEMERLLGEIEADDGVRVVVLTGAGGGFSAGADLMPVSKEERRRTESPSFPGDPGGDILDRGNRCILRLRRLPKPVVGSIGGDAVGIGCSLALATDLRIASQAARLGVVFSKIGLGPDGGASALLRELVGSAKALELLFLGDLIDAAEALRLGLVNRVVPEDALADATAELAERLARGPTLAYGFAKHAVYEAAHLSFESLLDLEARNQKIVGRSRDVREGIRAFREKRKPVFRGR
jgi:2-(1,2-epoxy-1,2-dihydrophenyl)acetyl-CoA isomerase